MANGIERGGAREGDGPLERLDPTLNIYALANGMDLDKEPSLRRLRWYRDGLERGIVLEAGTDGSVSVSAVSWETDDPTSERRAPERDTLPAEDLSARLSIILEAALARANAL